ncbi:hypothetical protein N7E02_07685 (plasmid) [Aliirhizobium terrae]|uniref:hypothetical protein n=1 Tax=Terrirhizobium terrae TaxID=2926709 RepID=UPI002576579F|nr:hypothetical protein [Rhizobium sp. CC-CFT758]WJH38487.1 hypothetical protein N7E02_07685 [Rhizobium sp. CC-CFT758]
MGKKLFSVYEVLVQGLGRGLSGYDLYDFVMRRCKASSNKRICRASLLAMSDDRVPDRNVLEGIYSIAADSRLRCSG